MFGFWIKQSIEQHICENGMQVFNYVGTYLDQAIALENYLQYIYILNISYLQACTNVTLCTYTFVQNVGLSISLETYI